MPGDALYLKKCSWLIEIMAHRKLHCFLPFLAFLGQFLERAHSTHDILSNPGDLKIVASKEVFENDTIVPEGAVLLYQKNTSMHHQNETMKKINELGVKLKDKVEMLHMNKKLDVVFLIDASSSVGDQNFNSELRFVKKLLADFAISENETRVAVITFSDEDNVIRHIDHISVPSEENHKCNMLHHDLPNIKYSGGLTYTLGALVEAQSVLEWSRAGAHKAIFLITDGFSNGGDPMPVADLLKANGTFIFTFGIQSGNIIELEYMSSSPSDEFSYFVGSFDQFEALVRRALHQDLSTGSYQHLKISSPCNSLCSDYDKEDRGCCDNHAHCSCGTGSGHYRCLCNPGFYGSGLKGTCHACPNGTYHDGQTPGDKFVCSPCPDPNHITVLGTASSKASCICKRGFVARGDSCEVITCPMLFPPEHGYFVKGGMCSNVFNAACGMRCKAGYSLHGSSIRLCQDNGMWSGKSPKCIVKMCPDPEVPVNGDVKCSLEPSVSNDLLDTELDDTKDLVHQYAVDTECQFSCKPGHILIGSRRRHCLPLARWDGLRTGCKPVACRPLNKIFHGSIHPVACTDSSKLPFGQTCNMTCDLGYKLVGPSSRSCGGKGGQWSMKATANKCIDEQPPFITCPSNIESTTDPGEPFATVVVPQPKISDNSGKTPIVWSQPTLTNPMKIPIGVLQVTFIAMDPSHNQAMCNMTITVIDKEPPSIESCISPKPIHLLESAGNRTVSWMDPEFQDNSGMKLNVTSSHVFGEFLTGRTEVKVVAYDESGNNSTCVLEIIVEESPCSQQPPKLPHARIVCNPELEAIINCSMSCNEGYAFDSSPSEDGRELTFSEDGSFHYSCSVVNKDSALSYFIPSCAEAILPNSVSQDAQLTFTTDQGACEDLAFITNVKNTVELELSKKSDEVCSQSWNYMCEILNTSTSCEEIASLQEEETNTIHHRKRNILSHNENSKMHSSHHMIRNRRETSPHKSQLNVNFKVSSHMRNGLDPKKPKIKHSETNGFNLLKNSLGNTAITLPSNVKGQTLNWKGKAPFLNCSLGSVAHSSGICVKCPSGTFFSNVTYKCLPCPIGEYQNSDGRTECLPCSKGMSTKYGGSRSIHDCLYLCQPGSYGRVYSSNPLISRGSVSPCSLCYGGSYQPNYGATSCLPCPNGLQSMKKGAKTEKDCFEPVRKNVWSTPTNCPAHLCRNGGSCQPIPLGFVLCTCQPGFYGSFCEFEIDLCNSSPCLNGGQCSKKNYLGYTCECTPGFHGHNCEIETDECNPNPCLNNGTCEDLSNGFFCDCPDGFQGIKCEENIDDCFNNPCGEHGQCVDGIGKYHCLCTDDYSGDHCEKDPDDPCLERNPCFNGGSCISETGANYICTCLPGWEGKHCDMMHDSCSSSPCLNNGTCVKENGGKYHCQCPPAFVGDSCQIYLRSDFILHLHSPSLTDYAVIDFPLKNFTEITACLWLESEDGLNYGTAFSYANNYHSNSFTLTDYNGFVLYVNSERVVTDVSANDGLWHHVCVIWKSCSGSWSIYLDGVLRDSGVGLSLNSTVSGGGKFILGQEQDSVGGRFSEAESLIGRVYRLDVWDYMLDTADISKLADECQQSMDGSLVKWSDFLPRIQGDIKVENSTFCSECPAPEPLWHGTVTISKEGNETTATYNCENGFVFQKSKLTTMKRRCLKHGSWGGSSPLCVRRSCGFPGYLLGGTFLGHYFLYSDKIEYICHYGTELVGNATRVCQADGKWSGEPPVCKGNECPPLVAPQHGKIEMGEKSGGIQTASFSCDDGFYMDGVQILSCMHDGLWDEAVPDCLHIKCPSPPQIQHATHKNKSLTAYVYMDTIHYECEPGYKISLSSSNIIYCDKNGEWRPYTSRLAQETNVNLPSCEVKHCLEPDALHHGSWKLEQGSFTIASKYTPGSVVSAKCELHFALHGPSAKYCNESSWWPLEASQCAKKTCDTDGLPYDLPHSTLQLSGEEVGDTAILYCKNGFQLHSAKPEIVALQDEFVGEIVPNSSKIWICSPEGFWIMNDHTSVSDSEAEWLACLPKIYRDIEADIFCNQPKAPVLGHIIGHVQNTSPVGTIIEVQCRPGFWLDGPASITCGPDGTWIAPSVCKPVHCHSLPQFPNMIVSSTTAVGQSMVSGDVVTFSCLQGFRAQEDLSVTCQANGRWSPLRGICVPTS